VFFIYILTKLLFQLAIKLVEDFVVNIYPPTNQNSSTHTFRSDKNKGAHTTKIKLFHIVLVCPGKIQTNLPFPSPKIPKISIKGQ